MFEKSKKIYFIEGNIGVGKSTNINYITSKNPDIMGLCEPLKNFTLLEKFNKVYVNNKTYQKEDPIDYEIQLETGICSFNQLMKAKGVVLIERNPYLRAIVFSKDKSFTSKQRENIDSANEFMRQILNTIPHETIYLDCPFDEKRRRIIQRNDVLDESYHKIIEDNYKKYIHNIDYIQINANRDISEIYNDLKSIIKELR